MAHCSDALVCHQDGSKYLAKFDELLHGGDDHSGAIGQHQRSQVVRGLTPLHIADAVGRQKVQHRVAQLLVQYFPVRNATPPVRARFVHRQTEPQTKDERSSSGLPVVHYNYILLYLNWLLFQMSWMCVCVCVCVCCVCVCVC